MVYGGPPPPDAQEWPFANLLDFAMTNRLGLDPRRTEPKWTAKLLSNESGAFGLKAVEAWLQGVNVPNSQTWPTLLKQLTDNEPSRYRKVWRRRLEYARDQAAPLDAEENRQRIDDFKQKRLEEAQGDISFRALLRQMAEENKAKEEVELKRLEEEGRRMEGMLHNLLPAAAGRAKEAEEARQAGDYEEAEEKIASAADLIREQLDQAVAITSAYATIRAQQGRLRLDQELYPEAAEDFLAALQFTPANDGEQRPRYTALYRRAAHKCC